MYTDVRSLAAVGKEKTRIGVSKPTDLNRTTTESSNIGKQSFNTSEGEEYTPKAPPSFILVSYQVVERIERVESFQDRMIVPRIISQGYYDATRILTWPSCIYRIQRSRPAIK